MRLNRPHPRLATHAPGTSGERPPTRPARLAAATVSKVAVSGVAVAALLAATGAPAHAQAAVDTTVDTGASVLVLAQAESVEQVLGNIRNWVVGILALLATVFLTIGGVRYILGSGDPAEIEKAKTAFRSACVGYALAVLAPLVVSVLQGIVGA